ncbi:MAG TPA: PEP-CTERM sorting domain-containing protein [Rhizomicrobium sp.]|jgi:hypothetical protein
MRAIFQRIWIGIIVAGAFTFAPIKEASANAMVDVRADWNVALQGILPNGISISCIGAAGGVQNQCGAGLSLFVSNDSASLETFHVSSTGGLAITNTSDLGYSGVTLLFRTDFSAFNPGGPDIGASITYPGLEDASFSSSVTGTGVDDFHSCDTAGSSGFGVNFSPYTCGVQSPDSSEEQFSVALPAPGTTIDVSPYTINISASLIGIPEPATLFLFGAGFAAAFEIARRKKKMELV